MSESVVKRLDRLVAASIQGEVFSRGASSRRLSWQVEVPKASSVCASHAWRPSRSAGARERRHMVQACRALRMQIKSFEDEFFASRGHAPRGAERTPLASTYRQYREWKRDIRDHAATQIQAAARCALARRSLNLVHTMEPPFDVTSPKDADPLPRTDSVDNLLREKRRIKQQLKEYDNRFFKAHGRMPLKLEKEPIRELYEKYHAVKARIATHATDAAPLQSRSF